LNGPWSAAQIASFLDSSIIPLRLAVLHPDGGPLVLSLWFQPDEDGIWCATSRSAFVTAALRRDPRCAFEVASEVPPYRGVRGRAMALLHDDRGEHTLERLLHRYGFAPTSKLGRTLLARAHNETAVQIRPHRMSSWDFSSRMTEGR
jgi:hypothetical protein